MSGEPAGEGRDAAWVVLQTRWPVVRLQEFLQDVRRLYRINPFFEFTSWEQRASDHFRAELLNHSNGQRFVLDAGITREDERSLHVSYAGGAKQSTRFEIEATAIGSRLTVTDEYAHGVTVPPEQVDRSLHAWGVALADYLERERRWGWLPGYRWFMERVWLPMKPSARRITFIVLVVSVADIALIALGLTIYWLEAGH